MEKIKLIVLDVDNTLFDWVTYYINSMESLFEAVHSITKIPITVLKTEAQEVFATNESTEYPFVIQELPSVVAYYQFDIGKMLEEAVAPAREAFLKTSKKYLKLYPGVKRTLSEIRQKYVGVPLVALTDAPRYIAMWKLNKLGILEFFDAVYGLGDPLIPICSTTKKIKISQDILTKHLQRHQFGFKGKVRVLPAEYEKPGTRGFKTILMDYNLDENLEDRKGVVFVGDNLKKDSLLGQKLGVRTAWAKYGVVDDAQLMDRLNSFSPQKNIAKNISTTVSADIKVEATFEKFSDLLDFL